MTTPVENVDRPVWARVRKFLAGYVSGCCLVLAGHPFDTIKVRMQSEGKGGRFVGVVDCVQTTVKREAIEELGIEANFFLRDPLFLTITQTVGPTAGHTDVSLWYLLTASEHDKLDPDPRNRARHMTNWTRPQGLRTVMVCFLSSL